MNRQTSGCIVFDSVCKFVQPVLVNTLFGSVCLWDVRYSKVLMCALLVAACVSNQAIG